VAGCCEHGNEPSGFLKFGQFIEYLGNCWLIYVSTLCIQLASKLIRIVEAGIPLAV